MMPTTREPGAVPNYDVHLFPVVRFTVCGIEALVDVQGDEQYEHTKRLRPVGDGCPEHE
jgi:hypothetical protein